MTHMKTQNFVTSVEFVRKISANIWSLGYYNPQGKILPKVLMGGGSSAEQTLKPVTYFRPKSVISCTIFQNWAKNRYPVSDL